MHQRKVKVEAIKIKLFSKLSYNLNQDIYTETCEF